MAKGPKILLAAAVFGQFLALLPFAVLFCGAGLKRCNLGIYCAVYAVWAVFFAFGYLGGKIAHEAELNGNLSRKTRPVIMFLSRSAMIIPSALFIAVTLIAKTNTAAFFYLLPGGIIAYFGAHSGVGKSYTDKFSRGWFVLYFISGIIASLILWSTRDDKLAANGISHICAGFAVMILLSALLANQTNIDLCTKQRSGGRSVLPNGLRGYNAVLITIICSVTIGLFVFAKPLAELIRQLIALIMRGFLFIMESLGSCVEPIDEVTDPDGLQNIEEIIPNNTSRIAEILFVLLMIGMLVLIFKMRSHILSFIKSVFAPLFKNRKPPSDIPFYDEILVSDSKAISSGTRRRAERELMRRYRRESDPIMKYRCGYALFLIRLGKTSAPPCPADTTDIHREKGENAFGKDLGGLSKVYNKARYGDTAPTAEELTEQENLLTEIK